jgi:catalase
MGDYPEFELGVQIVEEEDEHRFDFDLLDPTKIIPEELVPVRPVGKMVLNRNPDNFFAETEQVAFHPGHVVPGIDFTNDPLLQGRLFSYTDTQLIRLGGPNFTEIPINRPVCPAHNNQRDGYMRQTIDKGAVNYAPNPRGGGCPMANPDNLRAYTHYAEKVEGHKIRKRSDSFQDHYSQATLFWNSMSEAEKDHLVSAAHFELGKVNDKAIRQRLVDHFNHIDHEFAKQVARGIGVPEPTAAAVENHGRRSPALSMENTVKDTVKSRQIAILAADGCNHAQVMEMKQALQNAGAKVNVVSKFGGMLQSAEGQEMEVDKTFLTSASVMFDAIYVPGGQQSIEALKQQGDAIHFINEAFRHGKAIAATGEGVELLQASDIVGAELADQDGRIAADNGVVTTRYGSIQDVSQQFITAIAQHRHWNRTQKERVPA